ncbi:MAG: hypothetical protein ACOX81_07590 [Candidatus Heteroscillospira sp.]
MKNKYVRGAARFLLTVLATAVLLVGIDIFTSGMYLMGVPAIEDVAKVTIAYPELSGEAKEFTDAEHIELAVKLTGFLKYAPFEKPDAEAQPAMTITYFLSDGGQLSVSADRETVWWMGKARALKEEGAFMKLAEGIFFYGEAIEK